MNIDTEYFDLDNFVQIPAFLQTSYCRATAALLSSHCVYIVCNETN